MRSTVASPRWDQCRPSNETSPVRVHLIVHEAFEGPGDHRRLGGATRPRDDVLARLRGRRAARGGGTERSSRDRRRAAESGNDGRSLRPLRYRGRAAPDTPVHRRRVRLARHLPRFATDRGVARRRVRTQPGSGDRVLPRHLDRSGTATSELRHFGDSDIVGHWHDDRPGLTGHETVLAGSAGCPRQIIEYSPLVYASSVTSDGRRSASKRCSRIAAPRRRRSIGSSSRPIACVPTITGR